MANGVGKHKLLVIGPTEAWSLREKLCLATSVMRSGDQNWVSVSRAIKPFAEPGRPPDWFSQKHCASKYSELLENTDAPKRKRGEKGEVVETVGDVIVRRLTTQRIEELKKLIKQTQEEHRTLKRESELIQAGHLDSKLEELWKEIQRKQKLEEQEAELKRKVTDAAYQARQVAKNTPRRVAGTAMHSPTGCNSTSLEFPSADPLPCSHPDFSSPKDASGPVRSMSFADSSGSGNENPLLGDDPTQKKVLAQRGTPPPSPLLSELLKKGNILATTSRLTGERDVSAGNMTVAHDLQLTLPFSPASGAPMLSRLLEVGPSQFSAQLGFMVSTDSISSTTPAPVKSAASACSEVDVIAASASFGCQPPPVGVKVSEPSEEDVTVSYMADELDLKTVGDIIAIIEDKAADALDAAAVEAALFLCEENGHTLPGSWQAEPFHTQDPPGVPQSSSFIRSPTKNQADELDIQGKTSAELSSACSSQENCDAESPVGQSGLPPTSSCNVRSFVQRLSGAPAQLEAMRDAVRHKSHMPLQERWAQQRSETTSQESVLEDSLVTERQKIKEESDVCVDSKDNASGTNLDNEVNGPEDDEDDEEEEDGDGVEGFSSEPDGEMEHAASESEDACSLHTASSSLQLHTTADSIPSSPASSQFSLCSEDLEALQAHKIWKKAIMLVWRAAANHRYANVFLQPVTDEIAPGYHSIVHRPMDLATIKKNIESGSMRTTAEFQRDIMLMFQNAVMYNSLDHDVYHMAVEMQRDVLEQIQQFLATQLIMETSESGIGAKGLRGREGLRRQDSTDKDAFSMSSPAFLLSLFDGGTRGRRCAIEADLKMKK
ncbi:bromodomain-containing protein 8-like isoform X1 [Syngnathus typhle]|uniref:bromodomain-containing protein 8-like isoform X1 n=1 Tax=Syngnathus typhle TaxID=161592 RepID=UPI002A699165|nr:bromodomain-containing protein 8-like isoform X1 [Syngnathus typhle]XP_061155513.1 bromodomain-containing protein 8-like isoform X1 [Syngnathus typhle]XP_061155514.1 bromodomain-containing protein 8-like isoform X1 [Syngnathus typhle]